MALGNGVHEHTLAIDVLGYGDDLVVGWLQPKLILHGLDYPFLVGG